MKHTPGPWELRYVASKSGVPVPFIQSPNGYTIATVIPHEHFQENAVLLAAAPDLLSTWRDYIDLWNVRHEVEGCPEDDTCECPLVARINAAIAKAEGR